MNYALFFSSLSALISGLIRLAFATIPSLQLALIAVLNLVFFVIGCNGMFKRMHDYGASAVSECIKWWGIPFFLLIVGALLVLPCGMPGLRTVGCGLAILGIVMGIVFPFYLMLRPGEEGDNQYGEPEVAVSNTREKVALSILFLITGIMLAFVDVYVQS